ncbi:piggyBac transposable element-derived protein 4-like [Engraulis encrasicolus]|uniref:piggyBac transposable element-derived protein 4-like n=1 Tax=Engraulis encrasicolus TaxID=184585 RepID=UPI002FCE98D7
MAKRTMSRDDVLGVLFADPDSEAEFMPSDDDDSFSDLSTPPGSPTTESVVDHDQCTAQARPNTPDIENDVGPNTDNGSGNVDVRVEVGGRGGSGSARGVNRAGEGLGARTFYRTGSHAVPAHGEVLQDASGGDVGAGGRGKRGRSMTRGSSRVREDGASFTRERRPAGMKANRGGRGGSYAAPATRGAGGRRRGRGRRGFTSATATTAPLVVEADNEGWELLGNVGETRNGNWIKSFDEPIGYHGEKVNDSALDFLSLFLDDAFWNLLTVETNRYAQQFLASHELLPSSRFHGWYDVTVPEMKAFIALHLSMGLVEKHEISDYWGEFETTQTPGFGKVMSRNRFQIILSFLHFTNNDNYIERGQPGYDRIFKVRPIIDIVIPKFSAVYGPRKQLSLDEMTIAFKGRSTLKLYNPNKPDKYGYKVFVLSEAKSGYVLEWSMYTGPNADAHEIGASHLIVRKLMAPHTGKGHEVYMDSYYTSPAIATELASRDTGLCGTVSSQRRGMPKALRPAVLPLRKGDDPVFMQKGKMLACAWHDTKRLTMLSTVHDNTCTRKRIRTKHSATGYRDISRPVCVDQYNSFMGGVDTADQRMKTYLFPHRSRKWYNRIFNAIMSICMVNAHILYSQCTATPQKTMKAFVEDIVTGLLEGWSKKEGNKGGRPSVDGGEMPRRLTERHFLRNADDRPDCVVCSDRTRPKGRHQTKYRCIQCGVGLCAVPCNERYHTLKNFKQCHLDM